MEITYEQLICGKATKIKEKEYFSTKSYVEPFLERMSAFTDNFIIQAKPADQISLTHNGEINTDDIIYNRVWVQAVLPDEYCFDNHKQSVSLLYALDTRKPVVKIFSNAVNQACLNMCVFQPNSLSVNELLPSEAIDYKPVTRVMEATNDIKCTLEKLTNMEYTRQHIREYALGNWVDGCINAKFNSGFGNIKLSETLPINVYKSLFYDDKSKYYSQDDVVDGFTVYNAFTDIISNDGGKDLVNKFEKILLVKYVMGI